MPNWPVPASSGDFAGSSRNLPQPTNREERRIQDEGRKQLLIGYLKASQWEHASRLLAMIDTVGHDRARAVVIQILESRNMNDTLSLDDDAKAFLNQMAWDWATDSARRHRALADGASEGVFTSVTAPIELPIETRNWLQRWLAGG